jgi:hypothetical protein
VRKEIYYAPPRPAQAGRDASTYPPHKGLSRGPGRGRPGAGRRRRRGYEIPLHSRFTCAFVMKQGGRIIPPRSASSLILPASS